MENTNIAYRIKKIILAVLAIIVSIELFWIAYLLFDLYTGQKYLVPANESRLEESSINTSSTVRLQAKNPPKTLGAFVQDGLNYVYYGLAGMTPEEVSQTASKLRDRLKSAGQKGVIVKESNVRVSAEDIAANREPGSKPVEFKKANGTIEPINESLANELDDTAQAVKWPVRTAAKAQADSATAWKIGTEMDRVMGSPFAADGVTPIRGYSGSFAEELIAKKDVAIERWNSNSKQWEKVEMSLEARGKFGAAPGDMDMRATPLAQRSHGLTEGQFLNKKTGEMFDGYKISDEQFQEIMKIPEVTKYFGKGLDEVSGVLPAYSKVGNMEPGYWRLTDPSTGLKTVVLDPFADINPSRIVFSGTTSREGFLVPNKEGLSGDSKIGKFNRYTEIGEAAKGTTYYENGIPMSYAELYNTRTQEYIKSYFESIKYDPAKIGQVMDQYAEIANNPKFTKEFRDFIKNSVLNPQRESFAQSGVKFAEWLNEKYPQINSSTGNLDYYLTGSLGTMLLSKAEGTIKFLDPASLPGMKILREVQPTPAARDILKEFARQIGDLDYVSVGRDLAMGPRFTGVRFKDVPQEAMDLFKKTEGTVLARAEDLGLYDTFGAKNAVQITIGGKNYFVTAPSDMLSYKTLTLFNKYKSSGDFSKIYKAARKLGYSDEELTQNTRNIINGYLNKWGEIGKTVFGKNIDKIMADKTASPELQNWAMRFRDEFKFPKGNGGKNIPEIPGKELVSIIILSGMDPTAKEQPAESGTNVTKTDTRPTPSETFKASGSSPASASPRFPSGSWAGYFHEWGDYLAEQLVDTANYAPLLTSPYFVKYLPMNSAASGYLTAAGGTPALAGAGVIAWASLYKHFRDHPDDLRQLPSWLGDDAWGIVNSLKGWATDPQASKKPGPEAIAPATWQLAPEYAETVGSGTVPKTSTSGIGPVAQTGPGTGSMPGQETTMKYGSREPSTTGGSPGRAPSLPGGIPSLFAPSESVPTVPSPASPTPTSTPPAPGDAPLPSEKTPVASGVAAGPSAQTKPGTPNAGSNGSSGLAPNPGGPDEKDESIDLFPPPPAAAAPPTTTTAPVQTGPTVREKKDPATGNITLDKPSKLTPKEKEKAQRVSLKKPNPDEETEVEMDFIQKKPEYFPDPQGSELTGSQRSLPEKPAEYTGNLQQFSFPDIEKAFENIYKKVYNYFHPTSDQEKPQVPEGTDYNKALQNYKDAEGTWKEANNEYFNKGSISEKEYAEAGKKFKEAADEYRKASQEYDANTKVTDAYNDGKLSAEQAIALQDLIEKGQLAPDKVNDAIVASIAAQNSARKFLSTGDRSEGDLVKTPTESVGSQAVDSFWDKYMEEYWKGLGPEYENIRPKESPFPDDNIIKSPPIKDNRDLLRLPSIPENLYEKPPAGNQQPQPQETYGEQQPKKRDDKPTEPPGKDAKSIADDRCPECPQTEQEIEDGKPASTVLKSCTSNCISACEETDPDLCLKKCCKECCQTNQQSERQQQNTD